MGWLRKIGRKIDRGVRKVFGKNGWFKAAATVAALAFVAPIFGTGTMSFSPAGAGVGAGVGSGVGSAGTKTNPLSTITSSRPRIGSNKPMFTGAEIEAAGMSATPSTNIWTSMTDSVGNFFRKKGKQIKELPQTAWEQVVGTTDASGETKKPSIFAKGQALVGETADKAVKAEIIERAMGEEQFEGSTKGVQEIASSETALVQDALTYSFNNPQDMPSLSVTLADPVFAKWSNIAS